MLTVKNVAQGRDLARYETLTLISTKPTSFVERKNDRIIPRARRFLWQHWHDRKQGYLILTLSSVDAIGTSHVFVEQDDTGRWRIYWRTVRPAHLQLLGGAPTSPRNVGEVQDDPTIEWVIPAGFQQPGKPLSEGQHPDPVNNELEFRDKCGEVEQSF